MDQREIIEKAASHMREQLTGAEPGHDWWHTKRVWNNARLIQKTESGNLFVVELAALLHDIADYKFHGGDENIGPEEARQWLIAVGVKSTFIDRVCGIIAKMNFKGSAETEKFLSLEHAIVQDADRLDALGAIGIARCFSFGGHFGREIYNPECAPKQNLSREEYKSSQSNSINHFFEKLLLLRERMLTKTGRALAESRHLFMQAYLNEFFKEVEMCDQDVEMKVRLVANFKSR